MKRILVLKDIKLIFLNGWGMYLKKLVKMRFGLKISNISNSPNIFSNQPHIQFEWRNRFSADGRTYPTCGAAVDLKANQRLNSNQTWNFKLFLDFTNLVPFFRVFNRFFCIWNWLFQWCFTLSTNFKEELTSYLIWVSTWFKRNNKIPGENRKWLPYFIWSQIPSSALDWKELYSYPLLNAYAFDKMNPPVANPILLHCKLNAQIIFDHC